MNTGTSKSRNDLERCMFTSGLGGAGTLYRSTWGGQGGPIGASPAPAAMVFPTLDTRQAHLQSSTGTDTSFVMVANDDVTKCIVIDTFEVSWQNPAGAANPKALFGTLSEEGSTDDLIVWMTAYISGHFVTSSRVKLSPGKDLIHNNIKGPGQDGTKEPAFFKLYYHLVAA